MTLDIDALPIDLLHLILIAAVIFLTFQLIRHSAGSKSTKDTPEKTAVPEGPSESLTAVEPAAAPEATFETASEATPESTPKAASAAISETALEAIPEEAIPAPVVEVANTDSALQVLSLLQQEARFIDFVQEDLTGFSDAEIGAVARVIHGGSQKALAKYFTLAPVASEVEDSEITIPADFNPAHYRLTGNVVGEAPFNGKLIHRGWQVKHCELPKIAEGHDTAILAPAEVGL